MDKEVLEAIGALTISFVGAGFATFYLVEMVNYLIAKIKNRKEEKHKEYESWEKDYWDKEDRGKDDDDDQDPHGGHNYIW